MFALDKKLQKIFLGVEFNERTEIEINNARLDLSGRTKYINKPLMEKYGIREEDLIQVECKVIYAYSLLTKNQKLSASNGALNCVLAFGGSNDKFVKDTNCPVISTQRIPENIDPKYFSIYTDNEESILKIIENEVARNPSRFPKQGDINNFAEGILREINSVKHSQNEYEILFELGKFDETRTQYHGESKKAFYKRIVNEVKKRKNCNKLSDMDKAYPSCPENRRERYIDRSFNGVIEHTPECDKDLFSAIGGKPFYGKNMLYTVSKFDPILDNEFDVIIAREIVEMLGFKTRRVKFIKDIYSSFSIVSPSFYPRIEKATTLSPFLRKGIQAIFAKYKPEEAKKMFKKRVKTSKKLQGHKRRKMKTELEAIKNERKKDESFILFEK